MQVILQPLSQSEGSSVVVDTNPQATVASLISTFCTQRGIAYNSQLAVFDDKKRPLPQFSTISSLGISKGQHLLIGYKDKSFTVKDQWPLLVALGALIIGLIGILSISMIYGLTGGAYPYDYGVMMDAGSSKTNTIVYQWIGSKHKGTGCVEQKEVCKAKGGIAEMNPMKLDKVIDCAKKVTTHIKPESRPKTPLFFAATAGMRLLNLTNPTRVEEILQQLKIHLNETGLSVRAIEIISGEDEGIYGWITANFLKKTLETPQKIDPWVPTTYGSLDMGGASIQIAYALPESSEETRDLDLYNQTHNVFAHSDLCFGRGEAETRYRLLLVKDPSIKEIEDPCLPEGFTLNVTGEDLFKRPCTENSKFPDASQKGKFLENYSFIGTSKTNYCSGNVSKLLDDTTCKTYGLKECFKKIDNIPHDQEYMAFATYFFTTDFLKVTDSTLEGYEEAMQGFCNMNISEVKKISTSEYATQYCFNANYIHEVLLNGYGFKNTTWKNLHFIEKVSGTDVGWTLGYMINATNIIPEKPKTKKLISTAGLTVSLILFIIVIIGTVVFVFRYNRKRNESPYGQA